MSKHTFLTIDTISSYLENMSKTHIEVSDPRRIQDTCCGRKSGGSRSYSTLPCDKPAKNFRTGVVTFTSGHFPNVSREELTLAVGFCRTHDPILKAERARNKRVNEQVARENEQDAKARATIANEIRVEEINALAGEKIVQVGYNRDYRHSTVELVGGGALKLQALLESLVK
jgi:hypothetical protein